MDIENRFLAKWERRGWEIDWDFGVSRCKHLHLEWIHNKVLLYSTGNLIKSPGINHNGKEYKKECMYVCVYKCVCVCVCVCVYAVCSVVSNSLQPQGPTVTCQVPLFMDFSRQEYWRGLPFSPPGDLPDSGIKLTSPVSLALQEVSLSTEPSGKPIITLNIYT